VTRKKALAQAAWHYTKFCNALGIDLTRPDTVDTPMRVAKLFHDEFLAGDKARPFKLTTFPVDEGARNQLVTMTGIRFVSICAHHHLPIVGLAHVCYLPDKRIVGLSKIPRLVEWRAARPTVQENLTRDILDTLVAGLRPLYAGIKLVATHECMACRGVKSHQALTHTNAFWCRSDNYADFDTTKAEFQANIDEWYAGRP
jgi:GTP cyclohydrolase I